MRRPDAEFDHFMRELVFDKAVKYIKYYLSFIPPPDTCTWDGTGGEKPANFFEYLCTNENDIFRVPDWQRAHITRYSRIDFITVIL